jgi:hypothetical protein
MPYVMSNYFALYQFLKSQQQYYMLYYDRVWVQHLGKINKCTAFTYQTIEEDHCDQLLPFLCEMGTKLLHNNSKIPFSDKLKKKISGSKANPLEN